jgi:hypothetical protein
VCVIELDLEIHAPLMTMDENRSWTAALLAILSLIVLSWVISVVRYRLAYKKLVRSWIG